MNAPEQGRAGEDIAAQWLENRGYKILDRNYRVREGEIDIVAFQERTVVFVEVKWRRSTRFATPGESVGARKRARLRHAALMWMVEHGEWSARFDVIEMVANVNGLSPHIHHIVGAFV